MTWSHMRLDNPVVSSKLKCESSEDRTSKLGMSLVRTGEIGREVLNHLKSLPLFHEQSYLPETQVVSSPLP